MRRRTAEGRLVKPKRATRRRCVACGELADIADLVHEGRGRYIHPDCQAVEAERLADETGTETERAFLSECQKVVDAGEAEWVDPPPRETEPSRDPQAVLDAAQQAGLPLTKGLPLPADPRPPERLPGADAVIPAPTVQVVGPEMSLDDIGDALDERHDLPSTPPPGWPLRYGRLSASAMSTFLRCPEQFRREYIHGIRRAWSGTMLTGTAAHKAIEAVDLYRMQQGELPNEKWWRQWFDAKFNREIDRARQPVDWKGSPDEWATSGREAVKAYLGQVALTYEPLAVEDVFTVTVPGCPVPLVGVIDLRTTRAVIDRKFGGRVHSTISPDWRIQGLVYGRASGMRVEWHSVGWPKKDGTCSIHTPHSAELALERTAAHYQLAGDLVRSVVNSILAHVDRFGTDEPWPGNLVHPWVCQTCSFRETDCAWWHPKVSTLLPV